MTPHMLRAFGLFLYGDALIVLGLIAYFSAPEGANAMTALMAPGAGAILAWVCAGLTLVLGGPTATKPRGRSAPFIVGLAIAALMGGTVAWRASLAAGDEEKAYLVPILWGVAGASLLTVVLGVIAMVKGAGGAGEPQSA